MKGGNKQWWWLWKQNVRECEWHWQKLAVFQTSSVTNNGSAAGRGSVICFTSRSHSNLQWLYLCLSWLSMYKRVEPPCLIMAERPLHPVRIPKMMTQINEVTTCLIRLLCFRQGPCIEPTLSNQKIGRPMWTFAQTSLWPPKPEPWRCSTYLLQHALCIRLHTSQWSPLWYFTGHDLGQHFLRGLLPIATFRLPLAACSRRCFECSCLSGVGFLVVGGLTRQCGACLEWRDTPEREPWGSPARIPGHWDTH